MSDHLIKGPKARTKLLLVPCTDQACTHPDCPNHGYVVMELDGERRQMGEVRTRAQAYLCLQVFKSEIPGHSPQPEFLSAIRQATWLTGEMPSALFTPAGTRQGDNRGRLKVVPMPAAQVSGLRVQGKDVDRASVAALMKTQGWR